MAMINKLTVVLTRPLHEDTANALVEAIKRLRDVHTVVPHKVEKKQLEKRALNAVG
jgi:hypothetical protein